MMTRWTIAVCLAATTGLGCANTEFDTQCAGDQTKCDDYPGGVDSTVDDTNADTARDTNVDAIDAIDTVDDVADVRSADVADSSATSDSGDATTDSAPECLPDAHDAPFEAGATSCTTSTASCGSGESCCTTLLVPGGTFSRSYDGVTSGYTNPKYEATISDFRLDKYEVTVGRFRAFVQAAVAGYKPSEGSGKHTHVNCGAGLNGGTEPGWRSAWNSNLPSDTTSWDTELSCDDGSWTPSSGAKETMPMGCANWYQDYAFCIWDGGFLPTEAEWNYAAAGGSEQRKYPWGATAPGPDAKLAVYNCFYTTAGACSLAPVGSVPAGNGKWGHADLGGNVEEFTLDNQASPYHDLSCNDCAFLSGSDADDRIDRGGWFSAPNTYLYAMARDSDLPTATYNYVGFRCGRAP